MKNYIFLTLTFFFTVLLVSGQTSMLTTAEKSDFKSTSNYNDVMSFIEQLRKSSKHIRVETIATSTEGRDIPLLVIADPIPKSPKDLINDKRVVVYIEANIHAGEVEGKEAVLMYARDLLKEKSPEILRNVVLLICPLFNPDGNEKIDPGNRTYQNGPVNGVGVRYNGQNLDLNRDAMKAESPEVKGVIANVFNRWDPSVFMDCHTTDGSYHVEPVTFTWMVNPNGDNTLISYMKEKMVPEMSINLLDKYKIENCLYGEFFDLANPENGWVFDASEPRYMTNYVGLRNRLAILDENYVYADFRSRVNGSYYLIRSLAEYASSHKDEIRSLVAEADKRTISRGMKPSPSDSFAIEYKVRPLPEKVTVKTFEADVIAGENGRRNFKRSDRQKTVSVPYFIDYYPSENTKFPYAYLITTSDPQIMSVLKSHGIKIEKLTSSSKIGVKSFAITDIKGAQRLNQGHYMNTVRGKWSDASIEFPAGTFVVRTAQKLANVAAELLEPQSDDGLLSWNFFDRYLVPQWGNGYNQCPVYKVIDPVSINTEPAF